MVDKAKESKIGNFLDRKCRDNSEKGIRKIAGIKRAITSRSGISHFLNPEAFFAVTNWYSKSDNIIQKRASTTKIERFMTLMWRNFFIMTTKEEIKNNKPIVAIEKIAKYILLIIDYNLWIIYCIW